MLFHHQMFDCCTISVLLFHHDCFAVPLFYYQMFYCCTIMFHCSIIRYSSAAPSLLYGSIISVPLLHYQMFYCSTIRCSIVPPSALHCSTISWSTVPPSDVLLVHHLCSTVPSIFRIFLRKGTESSFLMKIYFLLVVHCI